MKEEYRKIQNYSKYRIYKDGRIFSEYYNRFITPTEDTGKYLQVTLYGDNKIKKTIKVHRLVAMAFLSNLENLIEVNHKDFNRKNNNVENLEWCNREYNVRYTAKNNIEVNSLTYKKLSPLTDEKVLLIPTLLNYGFSIKLISKMYNVGHITIRNIISGKTWRWLKLNMINNGDFNRHTIEIPNELYQTLLNFGVDNTVLNSRIKILEQCNAQEVNLDKRI